MLRHRLVAFNTLGHGIHSPFLYQVVRYIIYDENQYYAFPPIEAQRQRLLKDADKVYVKDYGTGISGERRIADIAKSSLEKPFVHQILFKLANFIHAKHIAELGTDLGIGTAYLASVATDARVYTFEGSHELVELSNRVWERLRLKNITVFEGDIDHTLPPFIAEQENKQTKLDFVFIDANHTYEATLRYFRQMARLAHQQTIIAIDDIHHSKGMYDAWRQIIREKTVTAAIDCFHMGLVFFNPQFEKREYKIRI